MLFGRQGWPWSQEASGSFLFRSLWVVALFSCIFPGWISTWKNDTVISMKSLREKPKILSPLSIERKNIVQHLSRAMRSGKPSRILIEGNVLTITMKPSRGRRGNFTSLPASNVPWWYQVSCFRLRASLCQLIVVVICEVTVLSVNLYSKVYMLHPLRISAFTGY